MASTDMYKVILNSLLTHVAVLDERGYIIETNTAWQKFGQKNGLVGALDSVGINYFNICDSCSKDTSDSETALSVSSALRAVIEGELPEFSTEYPCHSPTEKRWFNMKILPYLSLNEKKVIITHDDVTSIILTQKELQEKEEQLLQKAEKLEETNIAMKVLLEHRTNDRKELEERFLANIRELVFPYLEKLNSGKLAQREKALISIIKEHLDDITSPFLNRISALHLLLTPQELEVALLVRQGKSSQEISDILNISVATVSFHRKKLRKKLGLGNRSQNLRTYLLSLQ